MSTKHEEGYAIASWLCGLRQIAHPSELSFLIGTVEIIMILPHRSGEAMATHSSTLAWKIPWMEEPGRLQSMGSRSVGHD